MPPINVHDHADRLVFEPEGVLSVEDVIAAIWEHYEKAAGRPVMWLLPYGSVEALSLDDFNRIAAISRKVIPPEGRAKTALVVPDAAGFVKMCKYLNAALATGIPVEYAVFNSEAAALKWLGQR